MRNVLFLLLLLPAALAPRALAQDPPPDQSPVLVDRIVAVVDEEAILLSDLEREIESYRFEAEAFGREVQEDPGELRRRMLDNLIEVKLLVAQAKVDGITVSEEELEQAVANSLEELLERFGTRAALDRELARSGMTFEDLTARNRELMRNRIYTSRMVNMHIRPEVEVMDADVEAFYAEHKDEVPRKPTRVELANILVVPQPAADVQEALQAKMQLIYGDLQRGESFEEVARRHSEGPNAARGGLVGSFGRGDLFSPALDELAWQIPVGEVSQPVTTELGLHLIQVVERDEQQVTLRQILVRVQLSDEDRQRARERAEAIVTMARGGQDFAELARTHSDDPGTREEGGRLGSFTLDQLSPQFLSAIEPMQPGDVSDPVGGSAGYFVLKLLDRVEGGAYSYEEVKDRLRAMVEEEKTEAELERFLEGLRSKFFIEIKA